MNSLAGGDAGGAAADAGAGGDADADPFGDGLAAAPGSTVPTRISRVAALGSELSPSGKTVRTPPTGSSEATTGGPPRVANRRPARQLVSNRLRPGAGPSEKIGIARA